MELSEGLHKTRTTLLRTTFYLLGLIAIVMVSYLIIPLIKFTYELPGLGLQISIGIFVIFLSVLLLMTVRFLRQVLSLINITPETIVGFFPWLTFEQASIALRTLLNFAFLIFLIIGYWIVSPWLPNIPGLGRFVNVAAQFMVAAVFILFFWDLGTKVYRYVEREISNLVDGPVASKRVEVGLLNRILKTVFYFFFVGAAIVVSYTAIPLIQISEGATLGIELPLLDRELALSDIVFIVALGIMVLPTLGFLRNLLEIIGLHLDSLTELLPWLSPGKTGTFRRILLDILLIVIVLFLNFGISQLLRFLPEIGAVLSITLLTVVVAVVVLLFWDIGRTIYQALENTTERLIDKAGAK